MDEGDQLETGGSSSNTTAANLANTTTTTNNNNNMNQNNTNNTTNANTAASTSSTATSTSSTTITALANDSQLDGTNSVMQHLFSTNKWGVTPVRQDTPWDLPPSPSSSSGQANAPSALTGNNNRTSSNNTIQQATEFARAPGPASSIMDNHMTPKPFGINQRASTWSTFGAAPQNDSASVDWPKTTTGPISAHQNQTSNAFDLVPDFDAGKSWPGSMLIKTLDDSPAINPNSALSNFGNSYVTGPGVSKSPTNEQSGIGTWSPIVKGSRPSSKWDSDGPDASGDNGGFDDGTAIWGSPVPNKVSGFDWIEKTGDLSLTDKPRSMSGNNQTYRPQHQSSSSASLLMSSNTSPSNQHYRNQQTLKQPSSHSFDQVHPQSNALSNQLNQPNKGLGLSASSSNVPSTQQLKHMVQQIQLAVQAGHLNPTILNQPLAPVTLQLLYQLLQQIKILHQFQMQASTQQFSKSGNHPTALNVHITKTKQNILNLQNQIAAQQAVYLKQTQAHNISSRQPPMQGLATGSIGGGIGPTLPPGISQSGDSFRTSASVGDFHGVDSMGAGANGLANSLGHMHSSRFDQSWRPLMNSAPGGGMQQQHQQQQQQQQQQHLNEFARAPGPTSSIMDNVLSTASTWSAFGAPAEKKPEYEWSTTIASDLVPEFEPGKPWRGSMLMKSVEDDPTMTPGSMAQQRKTIWSDDTWARNRRL